MRICRAIIWLCGLGAVAAWGDDLKTLSGQTYSNFVVQQYDRQGLLILHDGGSTSIPFKDVSPELRGHYKALSQIPIPLGKVAGESEEPLGPNDLATLSGQIYRNVVLKKVEADRILIAHDTGMDLVYFSAIPLALQDKYRSGTPVVPEPAPGAGDIVTTYGQIFRNVEILRAEPDGLTFRHDGGVTKLGFPALGEELQKKHGYEPIAAWKYQREMAAKRLPAPHDAPADLPTVPATFAVSRIELDKMEDNKYWIRFSVKNVTDQPLTVQVYGCTDKKVPITDGKSIAVPALATMDLQQIVVPEIQPSFLKVAGGNYWTNCALPK